MSVAGQQFDNAGQGGLIDLETLGNNNPNGSVGVIDIQSGSQLDLSVAANNGANGVVDPALVAANAALGKYSGTVHLRAPQIDGNTDVAINTISGQIKNASSIVVEGFNVITESDGSIDNAEGAASGNVAKFGTTSVITSVTSRLVGGTVNAGDASTTTSSVGAVLHIQPGEEIINPNSTIPFQLNSSGSSLTVNAGSPITLPSGTPGNDVITSTSGGTLTVGGVTTTFQANTPITIPAGGAITLANNGTLTFSGGTGGAIPLSIGSGTFVPGSTGTDSITGGASIVTLNNTSTSSIGFAAGSTIALPTGTASSNGIVSTSAGTITTTSSAGKVTTSTLAANKLTSIPTGSTITFASGGSFTMSTFFSAKYAVQSVTLASSTSFTLAGSTSLTASAGNLTLNSNWNLATLRTATGEPGILTLRAAGNLTFNGSLTDGFFENNTGPNADPENTASPYTWDVMSGPSWSYRLVSGATFDSNGSGSLASPANYGEVQSAASLGSTNGNLYLGQSIPSTLTIGSTTATTASIYAQTIRTGTGDITIDAGGNVDLLNQLATIYTAGDLAPALPALADFFSPTTGASQSNFSGYVAPPAPQYSAQYTESGGNIVINAQGNIAHLTLNSAGALITDTSWQFPTSWLYRRGATSSPGTFGQTIMGQETASTTWWIDFSNFFESIGALGGGNITLNAGGNITNVDAVIPTNARMPANADAAGNLVELGGGNLTVTAGGAISGGNFYVENGTGLLQAGTVTTNSSRLGANGGFNGVEMPVTLFLGGSNSSFTVDSTGNLLIGPVVNPFWLPQGIGNTLDDQTIFETYGPTTTVNLSSLLGSINVEDQGLAAAFDANAQTGSATNATKAPWTLSLDTAFATGAGSAVDNESEYSTFMEVAPRSLMRRPSPATFSTPATRSWLRRPSARCNCWPLAPSMELPAPGYQPRPPRLVSWTITRLCFPR